MTPKLTKRAFERFCGERPPYVKDVYLTDPQGAAIHMDHIGEDPLQSVKNKMCWPFRFIADVAEEVILQRKWVSDPDEFYLRVVVSPSLIDRCDFWFTSAREFEDFMTFSYKEVMKSFKLVQKD